MIKTNDIRFERWTVRLAPSIAGTRVVSIRKSGQAKRTPRSREDIPYRVCEYIEAEDTGNGVRIRLTWDEVKALRSCERQTVTHRPGRTYVSFLVPKYGIGGS